jgi:hypothetical protein
MLLWAKSVPMTHIAALPAIAAAIYGAFAPLEKKIVLTSRIDSQW